MKSAKAIVTTDRASRYLQQLAKHFAHKVPTEFTPEAGRIELPMGLCQLAAQDGVLTMTVEGEDEEAVAKLESVVEKHLLRFAFRGAPKIEWVRS